MINEYEHEGLRCVGSWIRHSPIAYERAAWWFQYPKICGTGHVRPITEGRPVQRTSGSTFLELVQPILAISMENS